MYAFVQIFASCSRRFEGNVARKLEFLCLLAQSRGFVTMRSLLEPLVGNGTKKDCPILTKPTDGDDNLLCKYTDWAYALFAVVALIIVGIPFVIFICYVHRKIQNNKRARGLTHSISHESSSQYPYQVGLRWKILNVRSKFQFPAINSIPGFDSSQYRSITIDLLCFAA